MNRKQALSYVSFGVDDSLNQRNPNEAPKNARLVGWQCGFEPLFVAVWSYLPGVELDDLDAEAIAADFLAERNWFSGEVTQADYII
jgi:hypothetical protein